MVLKESLSLLVDGQIIHEAIVISNNEIRCFPCIHTYENLTLLAKTMEKLVKAHILKELGGYITLRKKDYTLIVIPLKQNAVLILASHTMFLELAQTVQSILEVIKKLSKIQLKHSSIPQLVEEAM